MPAVKELKTAAYHVLVWRIEEDLKFFSQNLQLNYFESQELAQISNEARKLEWFAARYVQRQLCDSPLIKDAFGKPILEEGNGYVSLSHCTSYAAAIYSKHQTGIDIEPIHEKVLRIKDKFLNATEQNILNEKEFLNAVIAAWSIKESIYKWYGKKNLSFKGNMQLLDLSFENNFAKVHFTKDDYEQTLALEVYLMEEIVLAFL